MPSADDLETISGHTPNTHISNNFVLIMQDSSVVAWYYRNIQLFISIIIAIGLLAIHGLSISDNANNLKSKYTATIFTRVDTFKMNQRKNDKQARRHHERGTKLNCR